MNATKRIPVKEDTWRELGRMKESGQTWDDLLEEMTERMKHQKFVADMNQIRDEQEFVPLDEA